MKNEAIGNLSTANLTDWAKVAALSDEEIICDEDSPATAETDWVNAFVCHNEKALHHELTRRSHDIKEQVAIRYDAEILAAFRATGKGWQTRMNNALKDWLSQHPDLSQI